MLFLPRRMRPRYLIKERWLLAVDHSMISLSPQQFEIQQSARLGSRLSHCQLCPVRCLIPGCLLFGKI